MQINDDPLPAATCFQQFRSSKPVRTTVDLFQRHPSLKFTLEKYFNGAQAFGASFCAFRATQIWNDPQADPVNHNSTEAIVMVVIASAFVITAAVGGIFRHCPCRNNDRTQCTLSANVFLVFAAVCLGTVIASKLQFNGATVQWNNISQNNIEIGYENEELKNEFTDGINICLDHVIENQIPFTLPDCYICEQSSLLTTRISSLSFPTTEISQTKVINFNVTLCPPSSGVAYIYWDDFTSMTFNETTGSWPCNPAWPYNADDNRTLIGTAEVLASMVGVIAPFSVLITPIFNNPQGCVNAAGFGTQEFDLLTLCGMNSEKYNQIPSEWLSCFTEAATTFAVNYTKNYKGLSQLPSASFPKLLESLVQGEKSKAPYITMGYLGLGSFALFCFSEWRKSRRHPEQQPLLAQAPAAV